MSLLKLLACGRSLIGLKDTPTRYRMSQRYLLPKFGGENNPFAHAASGSQSAAGPASPTEPGSVAGPSHSAEWQLGLPGAGDSGATNQSSCNEPRSPAPGHSTSAPQKTSNFEHPTSNIECTGKASQVSHRGAHGEGPRGLTTGSRGAVLAAVPDSVSTAAPSPIAKPVQKIAAPPKVASAPKAAPAGKTSLVVPRFDRAPEVNGLMLAAKWVGENARKLNPLEWLPKRQETARPTIKLMARVPVQGELSLDNVKVVRNDLSDTDVEVVTARSGARTNPAPAGVESKPEVAESQLT